MKWYERNNKQLKKNLLQNGNERFIQQKQNTNVKLPTQLNVNCYNLKKIVFIKQKFYGCKQTELITSSWVVHGLFNFDNIFEL